MNQEIEQRLKLSTSNIIALTAVLISILGGYIDIRVRQGEFNQRITNLEKEGDESKIDKDKFNYKLDKLIEGVNQIKVDMAGQRVEAAERNFKKDYE